MARRPHDSVGRCPYSAPVRRFHLCPAYEPKVSPVSDSQGRKLGAVMACHHLTIGHGEQQGRTHSPAHQHGHLPGRYRGFRFGWDGRTRRGGIHALTPIIIRQPAAQPNLPIIQN